MEEEVENLSAWDTGRNKAIHSDFRKKRTRDGGGRRPHRRELKARKQKRISGRDPGIPEWSKKEETLSRKEQRKWAEPANKNL
jgi:hypothetical protein